MNRTRVSQMQRVIRLALWLGLLVAGHAQQLPIKGYTTEDGLPHNHINRIKRDSRGYLWICTDEGLARYDGYRFINYGTAQGLPNLTINDFIETRDGTYWVATDGGICLFNPLGIAAPPNTKQSAPLFTVYQVSSREETNHVNGFLEDPDGSLWLATSGGLFHLQRTGEQVRIEVVEIGQPTGSRDERHVTKLAFDSRGTLWVMSISGLYRRLSQGRWERYSVENGLPNNFVQSLFEDQRGRLWIGSRNDGLHLLVANPQPGHRIVEKTYTIRDGLPGFDVRNITPLPDGRAWLCVVGGLVLFNPEARDDAKFTMYTAAHGLTSEEIYNLTLDSEEHLWVGTRNNGVMRIANSGFATFSFLHGFSPATHNTICESDNGELLIYNGMRREERFIQSFDGKQFIRTRHQVARGFGFSQRQAILQDHLGEWWVATDEGLYRYPRLNRVADLARAKPKAIYTQRDGLALNVVERIYEDQRGDIWMATYLNPQSLNCLHRWDRATNKIHQYKLTESEAPTININAFGEDAQGNLWIAFSGTKAMTQYRDGQFKQFTEANGAPASTVHSFFLDSKKQMWIATKERGLHRIDKVADDQLYLTTWNVTNGLATNEVWSITEDQWGRLYVGTGRGVDRLDPATGFIRHFNFADGLAKGEVSVSLRDRHNQLWFVTEQGVSRLIPKLDETPIQPPILITAVRVNGNPSPLSELGEGQIEKLTFAPEQNSVQIDFVSLHFSADAKLHYQYQLNAQQWSAPTDLRTISFANLAPGDYRFTVRAMTSSGVTSATPAFVAFTINRPIWHRWWFLSLLGLAMVGLVYAAYRYRVTQILALERVRTRIAADLHDDVGATLSLIAGISEMLEQQAAQVAPQLHPQLVVVANAARRSMDAMSDIVWMINPNKDHLRDLTQRIRRFASDTLTPRNVTLKFSLPDGAHHLPVTSESRRAIYLICKEAINNISRHAACTEAEITLTLDGATVTLRLRDNGKGFDPAATNGSLNGGQGLLNMHSRAAKLGGELSVAAQPGSGTEVVLRARLDQHELADHVRKHL